MKEILRSAHLNSQTCADCTHKLKQWNCLARCNKQSQMEVMPSCFQDFTRKPQNIELP